jgi:EpsI family protein
MSVIRAAVALAFVAATTAMAARAEQSPAPAPALEVPLTLASWRGVDAGALDAETAEAIAADSIVNRTYFGADGAEAGLYIARYDRQRPGVSIHSPLHCLPGTGWDILSTDTIGVGLPAGNVGSVRRLIAQKGGSRIMVLYWYAIDGRMIASEVGSRFRLLSNRIRTGRNDASLVRVVVPITGADGSAETSGLDFVGAIAPHLL